VIIREKDFERLFLAKANDLYDRVTWQPLTREYLEREMMISVLRGDKSMPQHPHLTNIQWLVCYFQKQFYKSEYIDWKLGEQDGYIVILPNRRNGKLSRLGIATVERDY
jgi:hypothetical protein